MPNPSASSKIFFLVFKIFWQSSIFLNVLKCFWPCSNMKIYKVRYHFWPWSKKIERVQKYWTRSKKFEHGQNIFQLADGIVTRERFSRVFILVRLVNYLVSFRTNLKVFIPLKMTTVPPVLLDLTLHDVIFFDLDWFSFCIRYCLDSKNCIMYQLNTKTFIESSHENWTKTFIVHTT